MSYGYGLGLTGSGEGVIGVGITGVGVTGVGVTGDERNIPMLLGLRNKGLMVLLFPTKQT